MVSENKIEQYYVYTDGAKSVSPLDEEAVSDKNKEAETKPAVTIQPTSEDEYQEADIVDEAEFALVSMDKKDPVSHNDTSDTKDGEETSQEPASGTEEEKEDGLSMKDFKSMISSNDELDEIVAEYGYDKIFDAMDSDGSGYISDSEFEGLGLDKKIEDLTVDDIKEIAKKAGLPELEETEEGEISPELLQKLKDAFNSDSADESGNTASADGASNVGGTSGGGGVSYGGGGGSGSGGGGSTSGNSAASNEPEEMSLEELQAAQSDKQGEIDTASGELAAAQSGEDAEVAQALDNEEEKETAYEEAIEEAKKDISEELKEEQKENADAIDKKEEQIRETEASITETTNQIEEIDSQVDVIDSRISALNTSLSNLPAKTEDNKNQHDDIDAMKASIEGQIEEAEGEKKELEEKRDDELKPKKEQLEEDLKTYKDTDLKELLEKRDEIEQKILEAIGIDSPEDLEDSNHPVAVAYREMIEARKNVETVQKERVDAAQDKLDKAKGELEEINDSIKELESMQIQLKNRVGGEGEDVAEFALKLDGLSAADMKEIMQAADCRFDDGAWCADFVTYVTKQIYGNDATPGDFVNTCSNTAGCIAIGSWADERGVLTSDSSQVQPGDYILYGSPGNFSHIGIVTQVNADGTVETIEGNTSDDNGNYTNGVVNTHSGRSGYYVLMSQLA